MTEPNKGGAGNCVACNHPGILIINEFVTNEKVELDGQTFTSGPKLAQYLFKKFPTFPLIRPYHISRHKAHVGGFEKGMAMILRGNKLFRPGPDGELEEIRQFHPEEALKIIISIGLDALVHNRMKIGSKVLVDAIKIYADITANREDPDAYDRIIAERHKGNVIDVPNGKTDPNALLDAVPQVEIPRDLTPPRFEEDEDEDDEE